MSFLVNLRITYLQLSGTLFVQGVLHLNMAVINSKIVVTDPTYRKNNKKVSKEVKLQQN